MWLKENIRKDTDMDLQNQTYYQQDETTFADVVKMFRGKMKILICVVLIAAALGAAAGAAVSFFSVSYEGSVEFYISPTDNSNRLVQFLNSDSFAEKLLLDEYGLPLDADKSSQDYLDAKAAIIAADEAREIRQELVKEHDKHYYKVSVITNEYNKLEKEYNKIFNELSIYKNAESGSNGLETLGPSHQAKVDALEKDLEIARAARDNYATDYYYPATKKLVEMEEEINIARMNANEARELAQEEAEKVLAPWREQEAVRQKVAQIRESITFEYAGFTDNEQSSEEKNNQNQAFLIVNISVKKDEEFANEILVSIMDRLPDYVEKSVENLTNINEVKCQLVSTFASIETSLSGTLLFKNAVVFALVAAVFSIVIVITVVILKNMFGEETKSNKKTKEEERSEGAQ